MKVQYSKTYFNSTVLLVEYHPSADLITIIPCPSKIKAKEISWTWSVGVWKIKKLK